MLSTVVSLLLLGCCLAMPMNTSDGREHTTTEVDCSLYRTYPLNANMYEVFTQESWQNRTCLQALVWDQDLCRCVNPPFADLECPGKREVIGNPQQYEVQIWGVWQETPLECGANQIWNQTGCRCDWDPEGPGAVLEGPDFVYPSHVRLCENMFNATFDKEIREEKPFIYIGRDPYNAISVEDTVGAVGGGAARIDDGRMVIWSLAGNDFLNAFQIKLSFKLDDILASVSEAVTLFSNDCAGGDASVVLQYTPASNSYEVFVRDTNNSVTLNCVPNLNNLDFHVVSLEYHHDVLVLKVDDENVCGSNDLSGNVAISSCPVSLGGDPFKVNRNIQGYLDEVLIRRNCVVLA